MRRLLEYCLPFLARRGVEDAARAVLDACGESAWRECAAATAGMGEAEAMGYARTKSAARLERSVDDVCRALPDGARLRDRVHARALDLFLDLVCERRRPPLETGRRAA